MILNKKYDINTWQDIRKIMLLNLIRLIMEGRKALKPPPDLSGSEWADKYSRLPETAGRSGNWRTDEAPHTRFIMDAAANPIVRQIIWMGSSQNAKTQTIINIIGRRIHLDPAYIMIMHPDDTSARDFSTDKLEPFIEDVKVVRDRVAKKRSRDEQSATLRKKIVGGSIKIGSALSKAFLRQRSAKIVWGDDIDNIALNQTEGDPVIRLLKRTTSFPYDYLAIFTSTPTRKGSSRIEHMHNTGNQCKFYVSCLECGHEFYFIPENLDWEKDYDAFEKVSKHYPETAFYPCPKCGHKINDREWLKMLRSGDYKPAPGHEKFEEVISLWTWEMCFAMSSMKRIAQIIIDAGDDPEKLEAVYNTTFGLPYEKEHGERPDPLKLMDRLEDYLDKDNFLIPERVLMVTIAVDLQAGDKEKAQRLEVKVMGWGEGYERWILYRAEFPGNVSEFGVWDSLEKFVENTKWTRTDGVEVEVAYIGIDTGWAAEDVYRFLRTKRRDKRYVGIKGRGTYGAPLFAKQVSLVDKGRVRLINIGTNAAKDAIYNSFKIDKVKDSDDPVPNYTHFPRLFCDSEYFEQIAAEEGITKKIGMIQVVIYEKIEAKKRNEALDLYVYNYVLARLKNPNFQKLKAYYDAKKVMQVNQPAPIATNVQQIKHEQHEVKAKLKQRKIIKNIIRR